MKVSELYNAAYVNELLEEFINGKSHEFGLGYNKVELPIVDVIMKHNGYHKFIRTTSPKFSRCYSVFYQKEYAPADLNIDNYFLRREF